MTKPDDGSWYSVWVIFENSKEGIARMVSNFEKKYNRKAKVMLCHKENLENFEKWFPDINVTELKGCTAFQVWIR